MKKTILLLLLPFACFQSFAQIFSQTDSTVPGLLRHYVSALAHDSMQGRATGTRGMIKAADFIANEMQAIGLNYVAGNKGYFQTFPVFINGENKFGINVMGVLPGDSLKDEIVIISAHYDHIGIEAGKNKDSVYNGANDDASGVAAVLYLAAELKKLTLQRTVVFIAFSGEELGLKGSEYLVANLDAKKVVAVFNFEMLGRGKYAFLTGAQYGTVQQILNQQLFEHNPTVYGKRFFVRDRSSKDLFYRSDNYSFAKKGIPAHTIMATDDSDKHYHQLTDEAHTLNYSFMATIVRAAAIAIEPVLNGKKTPKRIKPSSSKYIY